MPSPHPPGRLRRIRPLAAGGPVIRLLLVFTLLAASGTTRADIYKWTDANGVVHFSDNATGQRKAEKVEVKIVTYTHVTYARLKAGTVPAGTDRQRVILYGTSWCGYCKKARAYLRGRNIAFTDLDVETDAGARAQFAALGGGGVPVILVGDTRINGFNPPAFESIYDGR